MSSSIHIEQANKCDDDFKLISKLYKELDEKNAAESILQLMNCYLENCDVWFYQRDVRDVIIWFVNHILWTYSTDRVVRRRYERFLREVKASPATWTDPSDTWYCLKLDSSINFVLAIEPKVFSDLCLDKVLSEDFFRYSQFENDYLGNVFGNVFDLS